MPYLTKQFKFCAAHKYWNDKWDYDKNYKVFGEDVRIHGHNYVLDVTVTGEIDSDSGFVCDLQEIKTKLLFLHNIEKLPFTPVT